MQNDMVNCGNPYEEGDAVLDASTISGYPPITGELRSFIRRATSTIDTCWWTASDTQEVYQLCDAIDAMHAQLESDYKTACEVNERQDGSHIELLRQNESLRKKLANVREQLTNVQKALEDRNKGVLKQRWQKKCDALNGEIESLKKEVLSLKEQLAAAKDEDQSHAFAPESHYMMLPKDADGVPVHVGDVMDYAGDVMEWIDPSGDYSLTCKVCAVGIDCFFAWDKINGRFAQKDARAYRHYHAPTVEDVLTEFGIDWEHESDCEDRAALLKEYAAKLRLAGEK